MTSFVRLRFLSLYIYMYVCFANDQGLYIVFNAVTGIASADWLLTKCDIDLSLQMPLCIRPQCGTTNKKPAIVQPELFLVRNLYILNNSIHHDATTYRISSISSVLL